MYGVVYKITNKRNGKPYIGQTTRSIKLRFGEHFRRKKSLVGQAMRIEGKENFTIEVVEECQSQEELNARERFWIAFFNCITPNGYNIDSGGSHMCYPKVRAKRGSKKNAVREKKFHTRRKWDAYPVLEAELQKRFITDRKLADVLNLGTAEIDRKMTGQGNFSLEQMTTVKNFLGVDMPLEELFRRNPDIKFPGAPCKRKWDAYPILEAELQRQGIKCAQLAKLLGISFNSVSRRMQGIYDFTPEQQEAIKKFLSVKMSVEELFYRQ